MKTFLSRAAALLAVAFTLFAFAPAASAHVSPVDPTAPAGGYATVELQVPHGCDGQATNVVSVQLRDDISSVTAQAIPGTGLGLAIVRTIVEGHGGQMFVASSEGEGTTVRVFLPTAGAATVAAAP